MFQIFIFLVIGIIVGYFKPISEKYSKALNRIPYISLLFILFLMGIKIGVDPQTFKNIDIIGLKALMLAVGSILGSLMFMKLFLGRVNLVGERQEQP